MIDSAAGGQLVELKAALSGVLCQGTPLWNLFSEQGTEKSF